MLLCLLAYMLIKSKCMKTDFTIGVLKPSGVWADTPPLHLKINFSIIIRKSSQLCFTIINYGYQRF